MKSVMFLLTVAVGILILYTPLAAAFLDVKFDEYEKSTYLNKPVNFQMEIFNSRYSTENVVLSVDGEHMEWYHGVYIMIPIPPVSSRTVNLTFFPRGFDSGEFVYNITVTPLSTPEFSVIKSIKLNVFKPIEIRQITARESSGKVYVEIRLYSTKEFEADIAYKISNTAGDVIFTQHRNISISLGEKTVSTVIELPQKLLAGSYVLGVHIEPFNVASSTEFRVKPVHDIITTKIRKATPLYEKVVISVYNNGNVPENHTVEEVLPNNDWITGLITEPEKCIPELDKKRCSYTFYNLEPGKTAHIVYKLEFWPVYAQGALIAAVILLTLYLSVIHAAKPKIVKRYVRKGSGKHSIIIEIKNPFFHHLKNVIIRDWVTPLAHVLHEEIESVKPVLRRRSDAGTELIWKLGDIKPKETRILTYKIKTLVEGSLKMPGAYMRYHTEGGRRFRVFSKPLIVE